MGRGATNEQQRCLGRQCHFRTLNSIGLERETYHCAMILFPWQFESESSTMIGRQGLVVAFDLGGFDVHNKWAATLICLMRRWKFYLLETRELPK